MSNTSRKRAQTEVVPMRPAAYMTGSENLSAGQLAVRFGIHITTVWKWTRKRPGFPQPRKLGDGTTRWRKSEVEAWETKGGG